MLREEQPTHVAPLSLQEQEPLHIPPFQQVELPPQPKIEVHEIHSDLEEESYPATCLENILTSLTSSIPYT